MRCNPADECHAPATLRVTSEEPHLGANGGDIAPIEVAILDVNGHVVSDADNLIPFSVSGDGVFPSVANGNPASHDADLTNHRQAFRGLAMVLVKAADHPGAITIQAEIDGLPPAHIVIPTAQATPDLQNGR